MHTGAVDTLVQRTEIGFIGEPSVLRVLQSVWSLWGQIQVNSNCLELSILYISITIFDVRLN